MFASSFKKMLLKSMSRKFHGNSLKASATRQKIVIFQDSVMAADSSSWIQAREIAFFLTFPKHVHVDWKSWGTMKSSISFISLSFHFMYLTHFIQVIFLKSWRKKRVFFIVWCHHWKQIVLLNSVIMKTKYFRSYDFQLNGFQFYKI